MPIQSYLMMYFAGSGWQYGKRKISAMSNEQFNKLTPEQLLQQHSIELKNMLPTLEKSLNDVTPLVKILIEQYGDFIKAALAAVPHALEHAGLPILTGQAKVDYDKNFFDTLKDLFPSIPSAGATTGPTTITPPTGGTFGNQGFTTGGVKVWFEGNLITVKERETILKLRKDRRDKEIAAFGDTTVAPSVPPPKGILPKAGQTQKLARNELIKSITFFAGKYRTALAGGNNRKAEAKMWKQRLKDRQTELANLLQKYRW